MTAFDEACTRVEAALDDAFRRDLVAELSRGTDVRQTLVRLREMMRSHVWRAGGRTIDLVDSVQVLDAACRQVGFHVLHDWDGKAGHVNADTIVVDVLGYVLEKRGDEPPSAIVVSILVDHYFAYLLMLLATSVLGDSQADACLDRLNGLVSLLQGPSGSGQLFAADAETLFLIGTSHFEVKDSAYDTMLGRARTLDGAHRLAIAMGHAATLGSHLRFGYEVTYVKSYPLMRDDNGVDYRWLCFALAVLLEEYERQHAAGATGPGHDRLVEAIVNGLSADAGAFVGDAPHPSLGPSAAEWTTLRDRLRRYRRDLAAEFAPCRPLDRVYSPISLAFNFSHNVLKGTVIDALLWGEAWHVSFNDLLTGVAPGDPKGAAREKLARTLMAYARSSPDTIGGRLAPVIVYDPPTARRAYARVLEALENDHADG